MSFSIAGKTAIVTGAANGIGRAIARQFAEKGANVMFADMDEKALVAELGDQLEEGNIRSFAGDLREKLTIANLVSAALDSFDQIDILVNGARQIQMTDPLDGDDETCRMDHAGVLGGCGFCVAVQGSCEHGMVPFGLAGA